MTICDDEAMGGLLGVMRSGAGDALALADQLIADHPDDARLHFLRGSMLAGAGRSIEAHAALSQAVALAPDFALARFQLGFFELTSGEADAARDTWAPLRDRPGHYLTTFVDGLTHLIHDRFAEAADTLRAGIAANEDNPPLNTDMQLIVTRCEEALRATAPTPATAPREEASATSFLLGQLGDRGTTH
ncbi:hypothetical protein [uncultured Sphingomonas sp.]|uniref:hypothetical protein n=1 Tax=uncultured Sphingomonas sp. TaxID=158754 RepID=UPI0025D9B496|nr:hypothetical protein [uncultured Sphingomonas sp.]